MRLLFAFLLILTMINCGQPTGEFGWAVTNDEDLDILFAETQSVTDFKMTRKNLFFSPDDTIHYVYTFDSKLSFTPIDESTEFIVVLEEESLGFVEKDLKRKKIEPGSKSLKESFQNLNPGKYLLKVVFEQETIDSVEFDVIPKEGYSSETADLDLDDPEKDEIIKYSR
ncbi:MAG: hypothetical protein K8R21_02805 [Leptospira sp.]|nr:hypothetical protein [Leptospira sp.]